MIHQMQTDTVHFCYSEKLDLIPTYDATLEIMYNAGVVNEIKFEVFLTLDAAKKLIDLELFPQIELPTTPIGKDTSLELKLLANNELCTILTLELVDFSSDKDPIETMLNYNGKYKKLYSFLDLTEYELGFWWWA